MADLGFLAHLPELCDVTFMVGPDKVKTNFKRNFFTVSIINIYSKKGLIFLYIGLTIKFFLASLTVLPSSRIRDFVELINILSSFQELVCAVRAILAARSPVFFRQLYQEPQSR